MSYEVKKDSACWVEVILTVQSNGIDPALGAVYDDLLVKYAKAGATSMTEKVLTGASDFDELDAGVYRIQFSAGEIDTLGNFVFTIEQQPVHACSDFIPYYGLILVRDGTINDALANQTSIEGKVDTIDTVVDSIQVDTTSIEGKVDTIEGKVDTIDTVVDGIQTDVTSIDGKVDNVYIDTQQLIADVAAISFSLYEVTAGAYYNNGILTVSMVLHNSGSPVTNPTSATIAIYDEDGTSLIIDTSTTPDSQGIFKFTETVTLTDGTVPYVSGVITDGSGEHGSIILTPVVG